MSIFDDPLWREAAAARWHTYSPAQRRGIAAQIAASDRALAEQQAQKQQDLDGRLERVERELSSISSGGNSSGGEHGGARKGAGHP
jgi:hypothetical protein